MSCCPNCGSVRWKLASQVYKEGIYRGNTKTKGKGVVVGTGGVGIGLGKTEQEGVYQTDLSKAAAPPTSFMELYGKIGGFIGLILMFIYIIFIAEDVSFKGIFISVGLVIGGCIIGMILAPHDLDRQNMEGWHKVKMCVQCGNFYLDEEEVDDSQLG